MGDLAKDELGKATGARNGLARRCFGRGVVVGRRRFPLAVLACLLGSACLAALAPAQTLPPRLGSAARPLPTLPPSVRVGLATDLDEVLLPCCGPHLVSSAQGESFTLDVPTTVRPAAGISRVGAYRLQVAALKDEVQAHGLAARLEGKLDQPADAVFDAESDLYRVRVGAYHDREEAEAAQRLVRDIGLPDAWIVHEGGGVERAAFTAGGAGHERRLAGRWLAVTSTKGTVTLASGSYRGRLLVYINDRGRLNLINELSVDDYLRGVVPLEMGPEIYSSLEALKAQTIAARTYTLNNLGEFAEEGYDICATPRCQVYGGVGAEHPMSNRAVFETAGEVLLWHGQLADALYTSTCGGHTEDVEVVFPLKQEPYLRGVPCLEAGGMPLANRLEGLEPTASGPFEPALMPALLPPLEEGPPAEVLDGRLRQLVQLADLPEPAAKLGSLERRELQRYVAQAFDLRLSPSLLRPLSELEALLASPPPGSSESERRLARHFVGDGVEPRVTPAEAEMLLFDLARATGVLRQRRASFESLEGERIRVRSRGEESVFELSPHLVTLERHGDANVITDLSLLPGDPLDLLIQGNTAVVVAQPTAPREVSLVGTAHRPAWSRFRSDREIQASVRERYAGFELQSLEVLSQGVSGRVGSLRLRGEDGQELTLEGLAVRWTLDLPDTPSAALPIQGTNGASGWIFRGRGWGHGVGMCQVGAFGMAMRGHDHRQILDYYYSGTVLTRLEPPPLLDVAASLVGAR